MMIVQTNAGIAVPWSDTGKLTFKLDQIAPLNEFAETGAHSAVVDALAVRPLARLLATHAPELWSRTLRLWPRKEAVRNLVSGADVVVQFS
jgi:exodeoxyribonuclease-1